MYCQKCGKQIDDEAVMCPGCGEFTHNHSPKRASRNKPSKFKWSVLKLIFGIVYIFNSLAVFGKDTAKMVVFFIIGSALLLWWFAKDWKRDK